MNAGIVVKEFLICIFICAVQIHIHEHDWLYRRDDDTFPLEQWRMVVHDLIHSGLYVDNGCVSVCTRFEYDLNGSFAGAGGVGDNVLHTLNPVDSSFQRNKSGI